MSHLGTPKGGASVVCERLRASAPVFGSSAAFLQLANFSKAAGAKLQECEADCDHDDDCAGTLRCFQRTSAATPVPGCGAGGAADGVLGASDHCYEPVVGYTKYAVPCNGRDEVRGSARAGASIHGAGPRTVVAVPPPPQGH